MGLWPFGYNENKLVKLVCMWLVTLMFKLHTSERDKDRRLCCVCGSLWRSRWAGMYTTTENVKSQYQGIKHARNVGSNVWQPQHGLFFYNLNTIYLTTNCITLMYTYLTLHSPLYLCNWMPYKLMNSLWLMYF